jgi:hypothetical protein
MQTCAQIYLVHFCTIHALVSQETSALCALRRRLCPLVHAGGFGSAKRLSLWPTTTLSFTCGVVICGLHQLPNSTTATMSDTSEEPWPLAGTAFSRFFFERAPVTAWDGLVQLVPNYGVPAVLPDELQKLIYAHTKIPAWATDKVRIYRAFYSFYTWLTP